MRAEGSPPDGRLPVPPGGPVAPPPPPARAPPPTRAPRRRRPPALQPPPDSACVSAEKALALFHLLAAFWYVMGLAAVQFPLIRGWRVDDLKLKVAAFEEAAHYQGLLLVPGIIASGVT